eukprot:Em0020g1045a
MLVWRRPRDYWQKGTANPHLQGVPGEYMRSWYNAGTLSTAYRPSFAEIQEYLGASDDTILAWSSSDKEVSPQASVLGAPLSEGLELYKNLQQSYRQLT